MTHFEMVNKVKWTIRMSCYKTGLIKKTLISFTICDTVKLGYKKLGFNELPVIINR
jgi:hypothetical protein